MERSNSSGGYMQILDQAVEAIQKQGAKGRVQGAPLAAKLEAIAACGEQGARLWAGPQGAQELLAAQQATNKHLHVLADKLRVIKPAAAKPAAKAVKKPAAKKAAPKPKKKSSAK